MWTPPLESNWCSDPSPPHRRVLTGTHLEVQSDVSCQDAGPAWRTTGVAHFKMLIFKDALFHKQDTYNFLKGGIKDEAKMNSKSPELSASSWLFHIYLFFQGILTHRQGCKCNPLFKMGKGLWDYFFLFFFPNTYGVPTIMMGAENTVMEKRKLSQTSWHGQFGKGWGWSGQPPST